MRGRKMTSNGLFPGLEFNLKVVQRKAPSGVNAVDPGNDAREQIEVAEEEYIVHEGGVVAVIVPHQGQVVRADEASEIRAPLQPAVHILGQGAQGQVEGPAGSGRNRSQGLRLNEWGHQASRNVEVGPQRGPGVALPLPRIQVPPGLGLFHGLITKPPLISDSLEILIIFVDFLEIIQKISLIKSDINLFYIST